MEDIEGFRDYLEREGYNKEDIEEIVFEQRAIEKGVFEEEEEL